ncbi:MAG: hypothetical protein A2Y53_04195 [Chloroflexi bacterium RBG_16_47_49]|nr:MAG: hypothetical protein A2Y53_04195 [Chloroflexi bacterium RBG_16_47_49]
MISPEILRRHPFFGTLSDEQIKAMAMIAEEVRFGNGAVVCEEGRPADAFYLLVDGGMSIYYITEDKFHPQFRKEFLVGEINPGEVLAISAFIEPYIYTATVRADKDSQVLKFDSNALNKMIEKDPRLNCILMRKIAKAVMERLTFVRVQLAPAWAK